MRLKALFLGSFLSLLVVALSFISTLRLPAQSSPVSSRGTPLAAIAVAPANLKPVSQEQALAVYGQLPLSFEYNEGQTDNRVKFLSRSGGYTLFLTADEAVLTLAAPTPSKPRDERLLRQNTSEIAFAGFEPRVASPGAADRTAADSWTPSKRNTLVRQPSVSWVLRMALVGANQNPKVEGLDRLPGTSNYFIGSNSAEWRTSVPTYSKVKYNSVYPGVDLLYYGNRRQLEHDFIVAPHADPKAITLRIEGADKLSVDSGGDLVLESNRGTVVLNRPVIYQQGSTGRREVDGGYVLRGRAQVGFRVAGYDVTRPLVIDPTLTYSTYLGGSNGDTALGIAVDTAGSAYVTGITYSTDFPTTSGALQTTSPASYYNGFVTKLNAAGSALVYSTYLGGSGGTSGASGIAVDTSGSAYITGTTSSPTFPITAGAFQTTLGTISDGGTNAFVTKLDPTGSTLVYSTYLGGSVGDSGTSIAVDGAGSAYVTGAGSATNFPTTPGAFQSTGSDGQNAAMFVTKVNPTGSALVYSAVLGASNGPYACCIAVDSAGSAYITGIAGSADFPTTSGAFQTTCTSNRNNAFVTKLNPSGSALMYSTCLGGTLYPGAVGYGIAVDSTGAAYATGLVGEPDFPTTPGAFQTAFGGTYPGGYTNYNAFVTKLDPTGSTLMYSTYLGGNTYDGASSITVDSSGSAYIGGYSYSANFPITADAFQTTPAGSGDAFISVLSADGSTLTYSTFFGGSLFEAAQGIALDSAGSIYVAGQTYSTDFPVTPGAFQTASPEGPGGKLGPPNASFVAKFSTTTASPQTITFGALSNQILGTAPFTVSATASSGLAVSFVSITPATCTVSVATVTLVVAGTCTIQATQAGNTTYLAATPVNQSFQVITLQSIAVTPSNPSLAKGASLQFIATGTYSDASTRTITNSVTWRSSKTSNATITSTGLATAVSQGSTTINAAVGTIAGSTTLTVTAAIVSFSLAPTALAYGNQEISVSSAGQTVTLTNTGTTALPITTIALTGANPGQFSQTNTCGSSVAKGATCTINVVFLPTSAGAKAASVTVNAGGGGGTQSVTLSGTGTNPTYTLTPSSLAFANEEINVPSAGQTVTLTNTSSVALPITSVTLTGASAGQFSETSTCGTSVLVSATCTITVVFLPTSAGAKTATLNTNVGGGAGAQSVTLSGTGTNPTYTLTPSSLAFGNQETKVASAGQTATLTNTSAVALPITSITLTGANAGQFSETNTCGTSVPVSGSCTITVVFLPTSTGAKTATLNTNVGGGAGSQSLGLSGTGIAPTYTLMPATLAFGNQVHNTSSAAQTITLTNTGNLALPVTTIALAGTNPGQFSQTNTCGTSVAASATCTISVVFHPTSTGAKAATLKVTPGAGVSAQTTALSGTGT